MSVGIGGGEKRDRESEIDRVEEEKEGRKRKGERMRGSVEFLSHIIVG